MTPRRGEAGFSLLAVIVSLGLLATLATVSALGMRGLSSANRIISAGKASRDIDASLRDTLDTTLVAFVKASCAGGLPAAVTPLSDNVSMLYTTVPSPVGGAPAVHTAAVSRCRKLPTYTPGSRRVHACLSFLTNRGALNGDSFAASLASGATRPDGLAPSAFAEVLVELVDAGTGGTLTCAQAAVAPQASARVFYTVFWALGPKQTSWNAAPSKDNVYKQRTHTFYTTIN